MPLINKQLNAMLEFCLIDMSLVQTWWQYVVRLAPQSLTLWLNICALTFHRSAGFFSPTLRISRGHLVMFMIGKAVVLPSRITFKRIGSAILKLTISCLKKWCGMLVLSRELTNPVFMVITFGVSHTYIHRRRTTRSVGRCRQLGPCI